MFIKIVGLFALIAICNAQQIVDVYYESLCPDSQKFITTQLYPAVTGPNNLAKFVEIKLIPFGKSNFTTRGSDVIFNCHHGPNECYGNKIQACAIKHIQVNSYQKTHTRESLTMEYINCLMKAGNNFADSVYPGERCATETKVENWDVIATCANSSDGSKYLQDNGVYTQNLQQELKSVPTITYGQQYDEDFQKMALTDFRGALCGKLTPRPTECTDAGSTASEKTTAFLIVGTTLLLARLF